MCVCTHSVSRCLHPVFLQGSQADQSAETDMHAEYARQRQHLEHSVAALRKKLSKDTEIHRMDNIRVMQVWYIHMHIQYVYIHTYMYNCITYIIVHLHIRTYVHTCITLCVCFCKSCSYLSVHTYVHT